MLPFVLWYLTISLIGLIAFPLTYQLFPALADRGYAISKSLGLLLWGFIFWLLASLGVLRNEVGGLLFALAALIGLSLVAYRRQRSGELLEWWSSNRRLILVMEGLFFAAFAIWAFVRSANPEILGTEKPMELAFINAILNSPTFPPHDPWLSGYAISYYYFGYVIVGMLAKITAVPGSYAFNLGVSLVFGLSAIAAYGLVYSLLRVVSRQKPALISESRRLFGAVLGPLYVLLAGNLAGFLEILHSRGIFWRVDANGNFVSGFWKWLDLRELSQPPELPLSWLPTRYLWWWRASRVVQDYDMAGNWREVIDEFPAFSYLLADLHPHVLAMPFSLLAVALAMNLFLSGAKGSMRWFGIRLKLNPPSFWLAAVVLGGLAFLNTWDFPIYVFLFCGAYVLALAQAQASSIRDADDLPESGPRSSPMTRSQGLKWFLGLAGALSVTSVVLYLPFYIGFSSQAGGILPNLAYPTRGAHLWVMFGSFFLLFFVYLAYLWLHQADKSSLWRGIRLAIGTIFIFFALSLFFGMIIASLPFLGELYVQSMGSEGPVSKIIVESIGRRFTNLGWVTLVLMFGLALGFILASIQVLRDPREEENIADEHSNSVRPGQDESGLSQAHLFSALLILVGVLLVIFTEFFYLRDQFGTRMNTIFKFYYQAWLLWGIAAAFGTVYLLHEWKSISGAVFRVGLAALLLAVLVYPVLGLWTKTNGFSPSGGFTLDGAAYLWPASPDEMAAIQWLKSAPPGVVLEAVGPQYSEYARVATHSGQPTVLGWPGHESQWRGGSREMGSREGDIELIYRTNNWGTAKIYLDLYEIRYVFMGGLERNTYPVNEEKFKQFLEPVFSQGQVTIYEVPWRQSSAPIGVRID